MTQNPTISVIVPNYETDEYLARAVDSVLNQTQGNHEVLIVDGSGTDTVRQIAENRGEVTYIYQAPNGVSQARNEALDQAKGEFIAFLDADDYWVENKTERQLDTLRTTNADFVYADEFLLDKSGQTYHESLSIKNPEKHYIEYFTRGSGIPIRTVMCRQSCLKSYRFWEDLPVREDPHLWVRVLRDCTPCRVAEPLAYKTCRDDSITSNLDRLYRSELHSISDLVERFPELKRVEQERKARSHYKYGKRFLYQERPRDAKSALQQSLRSDPRLWKAGLLYTLASLPLSPHWVSKAVATMEKAYAY